MKVAEGGVQLALCTLFFFLSYVTQEVSGNFQDDCAKVFADHDKDSDGKLSDAEARQALKKIVKNYDASRLKLLMNVVPYTDGGIRFEDFYDVVWYLQCHGNSVDWDLLARFREFDKDGDRLLSAKEMGDALSKMKLLQYLENEVDYFVRQKWDLDRDGKLNYKEFSIAVNELRRVREKNSKLS